MFYHSCNFTDCRHSSLSWTFETFSSLEVKGKIFYFSYCSFRIPAYKLTLLLFAWLLALIFWFAWFHRLIYQRLEILFHHDNFSRILVVEAVMYLLQLFNGTWALVEMNQKVWKKQVPNAINVPYKILYPRE